MRRQEGPGQAEPRGGGQRRKPRTDAGGEEQAMWEGFLEVSGEGKQAKPQAWVLSLPGPVTSGEALNASAPGSALRKGTMTARRQGGLEAEGAWAGAKGPRRARVGASPWGPEVTGPEAAERLPGRWWRGRCGRRAWTVGRKGPRPQPLAAERTARWLFKRPAGRPASRRPDWLRPLHSPRPRSGVTPFLLVAAGWGRVPAPPRAGTVAVFAVLAERRGRASLPGRRCREGRAGSGGSRVLIASPARSPEAGLPRRAPRATFPARAPEAQARGLWRGPRPAADGRPGPQVRGSPCSAPVARADPERPCPASCRREPASRPEAGPGPPGRPSSRTLHPRLCAETCLRMVTSGSRVREGGGGGCLLAGAAGSDLSSLCGGDRAVRPPGRSSHCPGGLGPLSLLLDVHLSSSPHWLSPRELGHDPPGLDVPQTHRHTAEGHFGWKGWSGRAPQRSWPKSCDLVVGWESTQPAKSKGICRGRARRHRAVFPPGDSW